LIRGEERDVEEEIENDESKIKNRRVAARKRQNSMKVIDTYPRIISPRRLDRRSTGQYRPKSSPRALN
jgi:hypothetical protein